MNQRDTLAAEATGYNKGYAYALRVVQHERDARRWEAYDTGYAHGKRDEQARRRRIEWAKLFVLIVTGAFVAHLLFNLIALFI